MKIKAIKAYEILDSRAMPTIECQLILDDDHVVTASVPSGLSVGTHEACELRDGDKNRYHGMGVLNAIDAIHTGIAPHLIGKEPDFMVMDKFMKDLDGTENKVTFGTNSILAVSFVLLRAQAYLARMPLHQFIASYFHLKAVTPNPMFNILNGGMHASNGLLFQEFMIVPAVERAAESVRMAAEIYYSLKQILKDEGYSVAIGDEGGFAPRVKGILFEKERAALTLLMRAVDRAGYNPGKDVSLALDVAASTFFCQKQKKYCYDGVYFSSTDLLAIYQDFLSAYPIISIEDGMGEDDMLGWEKMTEELGAQVMLVGDDLFVTRKQNIAEGITHHRANAVLIKPNQIGTVSETVDAVLQAHQGHYKTVASHRSGETNDTMIVDLAVGLGINFLKAGAPARGERVAKYNHLITLSRGFR